MRLGGGRWVKTVLSRARRRVGNPWWGGVVGLGGGMGWINAGGESLIHAWEMLSAEKNWNHFVGGTVGEIISTLPEFVVITFVVAVDPDGDRARLANNAVRRSTIADDDAALRQFVEDLLAGPLGIANVFVDVCLIRIGSIRFDFRNFAGLRFEEQAKFLARIEKRHNEKDDAHHEVHAERRHVARATTL